jgi:hypothetical protein
LPPLATALALALTTALTTALATTTATVTMTATATATITTTVVATSTATTTATPTDNATATTLANATNTNTAGCCIECCASSYLFLWMHQNNLLLARGWRAMKSFPLPTILWMVGQENLFKILVLTCTRCYHKKTLVAVEC